MLPDALCVRVYWGLTICCVGLVLRCVDEQVMPFGSEQMALPARRDGTIKGYRTSDRLVL